MDGLMACCVGRCFPHSSVRIRYLSRRNIFQVNSSRSDGDFSADRPHLDHWDKMELKFGRLLGEDPKLTLAKILGRKSNPDASNLDIEKSFQRNKGKQNKDIDYDLLLELEESVLNPTDAIIKNKKMDTNINLVRPVMKKRDLADLPVQKPAANKQDGLESFQIDSEDHLLSTSLRKPSKPKAFEIDNDKTSKIQIKPNILLKMRKESKLEPVDLLVNKPERISLALGSNELPMYSSSSSTSDHNQENIKLSDDGLEVDSFNRDVKESIHKGLTGVTNQQLDGVESDDNSTTGREERCLSTSNLEDFLKGQNHLSEASVQDEELMTEMQSIEQKPNESSYTGNMSECMQSLASDLPAQAALLGKPQRLDSSLRKQMPVQSQVKRIDFKENLNDTVEKNFVSKPVEEHEGNDWEKAEVLLNSGERVEVELMSYSSRGFVVSFGSLIGFLPYRKLSGRWKFLSFESWLRKKGLESSSYKQDMEVTENMLLDKDHKDTLDTEIGDKVAPNVELNGLLDAYDQEKSKHLSSFVGQKIKVNVMQADRNSRRLVFSGKPKENEELTAKKKALMARLNIGDVVKCCITKITYFGIFVEVEGVPALIHHSEVSWDATLDPNSCFTVGQIVDAKVHHLDFSLERISLSLKQVTPDPLLETLESVVDAYDSSSVNLDFMKSDVQWSDVEQLMEELKKIEGIESVAKGRFFLTPGMAPTFQVYMASMVDNQYKLLARSENKVQEVLVQASLGKEQMKSAILTCTGRVQ